MITKEEVERIAKLARLELTEKEIEKIQKDLSAILDYFNLLKKAPKVKEEKPASRPKGYPATAWRRDEVKRNDLADEIIAAAPDKKDDYIKVKTVF